MPASIPKYKLWEMLPMSDHQPILLITLSLPFCPWKFAILEHDMWSPSILLTFEVGFLQTSIIFLEAGKYGASLKPSNLVVLSTVGTLGSLKTRSLR